MKKVLIIEDDQIVAHIYRNKFLVEGFQVEVAHTGEAGLQLIHNFQPDAVLLDLVLPKMSGVDVMKEVRAESQFKALPLVVFSNTYLTNLVQDAWKAGATKCLSKASCTPRQVIDAVRTTLNLKEDSAYRIAAPASIPPGPAPRPRANPEVEGKFHAELQEAFVITLPDVLANLRGSVQALSKADTESARAMLTQDLYRRVHTLAGNANLAGLTVISQLAEVFEALLRELHEKPGLVNPSTLRTVATTVDFLGVLFDRAAAPGRQDPPSARILVVDDEAISRRAITSALERARLKSTAVEDAKVAYQLISEVEYDLIFLDVDMPEMNGFELCARIRALPRYKSTPVIFVTSLNDFESRASSLMSGGNDFIAKPFHFLELAVKALVYVLRGQYPVVKKR